MYIIICFLKVKQNLILTKTTITCVFYVKHTQYVFRGLGAHQRLRLEVDQKLGTSLRKTMNFIKIKYYVFLKKFLDSQKPFKKLTTPTMHTQNAALSFSFLPSLYLSHFYAISLLLCTISSVFLSFLSRNQFSLTH